MVAKLATLLDDPDFIEQQTLLAERRATAAETPEAIAKKEAEAKKTASVDALTQQILAQKTTDKWTGEGYGGAEANAKAMAKLLADAGITDIKQFGKVDKYEPVEVTGYTLNGKTVQNPSNGKYYEETTEWSEGNGYTTNVRYLSPQEIAQVKPQYGIVEYDADGGRVVKPVTNVIEKDGKLLGVTGQTYGNKETGQAIESGTGRWQEQGGEGLFSGTGEGEGNTGFRVDFTPDGTPVFYTTQGTSNDLALAIQGLGPIGSMAANYLAFQFGGPAGVAALNAAQGKSAEDVAKSALLAYAGGEFSKAVSPYLPTPDAPIDFVGGTTESINDAVNANFINDLKAAGVTNVSEFLTNVGGNAGSFVPSEAPVVASPVETVQVSAPSAPTVAPTLADVISSIVATPQTPVATPIENVQVSSESGSKAGSSGGNSGLIVIGSDEYGFPVYGTVDSFAADNPINLSNGRIEAPAYVGFNPDTDLGSGFDSNVISYEGGEGGYEGGSEGGGGGEEQVPNIQVTAPIVTPTAPPVVPTLSDVISSIVTQQPVTPPEPVAPVETVQVTAPQAPVAPPVTPTIADVISSIVQTQVTPSTTDMVVTGEAPKPVEPEQPVIPVIPPTEMVVTGDRPITNEAPSTITNEVTPAPIIVPSQPIDTSLPDKKYTTSEIVDMVRLGLLGASVFGAANADTGPTQYDIVPVPADWKSPVYQKDLPATAPTQLPPIDFGTRDLLKGTQWEKLLNPSYGQVPAPVQFNQPSDMSYDRLMSILGSGRDTLPSQALTINDVISGIQNQYGQTPTSTMG